MVYPKTKHRELTIAGLTVSVACVATKSAASCPSWVLAVLKRFPVRGRKLEEVATRAIFPDFDYALIAAISG